jgi:hypothetical protein
MGIDNVNELTDDESSEPKSVQDGLTDSAPDKAKEWDRDTQAPVEDDPEQEKRRAARADSEQQLAQHRQQANDKAKAEREQVTDSTKAWNDDANAGDNSEED